MKIVIAGAGEVGTHLAKLLVEEDHDIVLLDDNEKKLNQLSSNYDILTVVGKPHLISDLKDSKVKGADLFIAVTPSESLNIVACQLAKTIGAVKTIARIDNREYLQQCNRDLFSKMGIDEMIYPEELASRDIRDLVSIVSYKKIIEFSDSKLILFAVRIKEDSVLRNRNFSKISKDMPDVRAVAVNRGCKTFIPYGRDSILLNDIVYFISKSKALPKLVADHNYNRASVKKVMILGGSRIGVKTANFLGEDYNIKIVDRDREQCNQVVEEVSHALVLHGDGSDLEFLKSEGIENVDAFVAVTGSDETNIVASHMARKLGVGRTIAEIENPDYVSFAETVGIGGVINKKRLAVGHIHRHTINADISQINNIVGTEAEVFEITLGKKALITKKSLSDITLPENLTIGGYIRDGKGHIADGETKLVEGDKVIIVAIPSGIKEIAKYFR